MKSLGTKALIWLGCIVGYFVINLLLTITFGFVLGYGLGFIVVIFLPKYLCRKWDRHQFDEEAKRAGKTTIEYVKGNVPTSVITLCENHKGEADLRNRLDVCVESNTISKMEMTVLLEEYGE